MPPRQWHEALHELERRVGHVAAQLDLDADELLNGARALAEATIVVVPDDVYEGYLDEARDRDFFGSGIATWRAEILARVLELD